MTHVVSEKLVYLSKKNIQCSNKDFKKLSKNYENA